MKNLVILFLFLGMSFATKAQIIYNNNTGNNYFFFNKTEKQANKTSTHTTEPILEFKSPLNNPLWLDNSCISTRRSSDFSFFSSPFEPVEIPKKKQMPVIRHNKFNNTIELRDEYNRLEGRYEQDAFGDWKYKTWFYE